MMLFVISSISVTDEDVTDRHVTVLLNAEESTLEIIDRSIDTKVYFLQLLFEAISLTWFPINTHVSMSKQVTSRW